MTFFLLFLIYILSLDTFNNAAPTNGCKLNIKNDLPKKNEPLLLFKDNKEISYHFLLPEISKNEGYIELKHGQEILLACSGNKNFINETQQALNIAHCKSGRKLIIEKEIYDSVLLDCRKNSGASIQKTGERCFGGKGNLLEIGFSSGGWHPVVTVCHNIKQSETYYSKHTLYGSKLSAKIIRKNGRPGFSRGEKYLFEGIKPDDAYSKENQVQIFQDTIGTVKVNEYLKKPSMFLARGHLAPDADFIFTPWQLATYFYINVAPQWQSINAGHWLSIETYSRKIASKLSADLEVATGTHGILKLEDSEGKERKLYLSSNKVSVPEYFWKFLRNPETNECIGFIITNDPYLKTVPSHKCTDICSKSGWPTFGKNMLKGYIYCCDYASMKKAIPEMPQFKCKAVLKYR